MLYFLFEANLLLCHCFTMNNTPSKIMAIDIAEQHRSFFNLKAFGINNDGQVVDESKMSKLDSKGLTSEKWERILSVITHWKDIESVGRDEARIQKEYQKTHSSEWKKDRVDFHHWKMINAGELGATAKWQHSEEVGEERRWL